MQSVRIMIDPGHGGRDPGAVNGKYREAEFNATLAERLRSHLECMGWEVHLSRPLEQGPQDYTSPTSRAQLANVLGVDVFLSLHTNAFTRPQARGGRFFVHRQGGPLGERGSAEALAGALQTQARVLLEPDMPVGRVEAMSSLTVLRRTDMPAVLAETGFISNPQDLSLLTCTAFLHRAAIAYAVGLVAWAKRNLPRAA